MATRAHTAPPLGASRRSIITPTRPDQAPGAAGPGVHDPATDNYSPPRGVLYHPNGLQRALAYLASGDLPPLPVFRLPQIPLSSLVAGYIAAIAMGSFGFGLILAGGLL
ncbi:MAG TPA: hypothetical protein VNZ61_21005 [Roseomonas sp.]|nr:hypothetical protein [Roseomonas sp.]